MNPTLDRLEPGARISDVILALENSKAKYLCHALEYEMSVLPRKDTWRWQLYYKAQRAIEDFCKMHGCNSLVGVLNLRAREDGPSRSYDVYSQDFRVMRARWCRDYAEFLREFGL